MDTENIKSESEEESEFDSRFYENLSEADQQMYENIADMLGEERLIADLQNVIKKRVRSLYDSRDSIEQQMNNM